jgi:hypothetical protein
MSSSYSFRVDEVEKYLNKIFELSANLKEKDSKISLLEFELAIEKQLLAAFKKHHLPALPVK